MCLLKILTIILTFLTCTLSQDCDDSRFQRATITYTEASPYVRRMVISKFGIHPLRYAELIEIFPQPLDQICANTFDNLFNLKKVVITGCDLTYLEPEAFVNLPKLETLDLSFNHLTDVYSETFTDLPLVNLYLVHNYLIRLHKDAFKGTDQLKHLHLQYNRLSTIASGIFNNLTVVNLRLDHNRITHIDGDAFDDMELLQTIYLNNNKLKHYHSTWFQNCPKLAVLNLGKNELKYLPSYSFKNFKDTPYLVDVRLDDNGLWNLQPGAFSKGPKFRFVTLSHNNISEIPEDLFKGSAVGDINLEFNSIKCLPRNLKDILVASHMHYLDNNPWNETCLNELIKYSRQKNVKIHVKDAFI